MRNEWPAKNSNDVLEACFTRGKKPFADVYQDLKALGRVKTGDEVKHANVKIYNDQSTYSCYFIALENPVVFNGETKTYDWFINKINNSLTKLRFWIYIYTFNNIILSDMMIFG